MKLSKQTTDAVEILVHCKRHGDGLIKVADLADAVGLTRQMALKLCYMLNQAGLLDTTRGPKGGVRLPERAADATLGEIVRALEVQPTTQRGGGAPNPQMAGFFGEAFEAFLSVLDEHTLSDLASQPKKKPAGKTRSRTPRPAAKAARTPGGAVRTAPRGTA